MKNRFATKTMSSLTLKQLIDIEEYDEYWDKIIRAASRRLRKKLKDQQTREFSESDIQEGIAELNDGIRSKNQVTQVCQFSCERLGRMGPCSAVREVPVPAV